MNRFSPNRGARQCPTKSSAKQTLPYHPLLEPFRCIFRPIFENLWIKPEPRNFHHPVSSIHVLKIQNFKSVGRLDPKLGESKVSHFRHSLTHDHQNRTSSSHKLRKLKFGTELGFNGHVKGKLSKLG